MKPVTIKDRFSKFYQETEGFFDVIFAKNAPFQLSPEAKKLSISFLHNFSILYVVAVSLFLVFFLGFGFIIGSIILYMVALGTIPISTVTLSIGIGFSYYNFIQANKNYSTMTQKVWRHIYNGCLYTSISLFIAFIGIAITLFSLSPGHSNQLILSFDYLLLAILFLFSFTVPIMYLLFQVKETVRLTSDAQNIELSRLELTKQNSPNKRWLSVLYVSFYLIVLFAFCTKAVGIQTSISRGTFLGLFGGDITNIITGDPLLSRTISFDIPIVYDLSDSELSKNKLFQNLNIADIKCAGETSPLVYLNSNQEDIKFLDDKKNILTTEKPNAIATSSRFTIVKIIQDHRFGLNTVSSIGENQEGLRYYLLEDSNGQTSYLYTSEGEQLYLNCNYDRNKHIIYH